MDAYPVNITIHPTHTHKKKLSQQISILQKQTKHEIQSKKLQIIQLNEKKCKLKQSNQKRVIIFHSIHYIIFLQQLI